MSHGFHLFVVCALSWFGSVASGPRSSRGSCEYSVQVFYWLYINVQDETDKLQLSGLGMAANE